MKHIKIKKCPYCGGTQFTKGVQECHGSIMGENMWAGGQPLRHVVCLNCGCVVLSYVAEPKMLLSRKHRKELEASKEDA